MRPADYSFLRYLQVKQSIDDRALNLRVWRRLKDLIPSTGSANPLSILEVGSGSGGMIARLLDRRIVAYAQVTTLEREPALVGAALQFLSDKARRLGFDVQGGRPGRMSFNSTEATWHLHLVAADLFEYLPAWQDRRPVDLLLAHAFLDLADLETTLPLLFGCLRPGGLFYFTLNFDGLTAFEPAIEPLDSLLLSVYHHSMDVKIKTGGKPGSSQTGRRLFEAIPKFGGEIIEAGSSDWVVFPGESGYQEGESFFLHYIIHTIKRELEQSPEIDPEQLQDWAARRHAQIDEQRLVFLTHQLDLLGRIGRQGPRR